MSTHAATGAAARVWLDRARDGVARAAARVEDLPVPAVLGGMVAVEWACVLALARTVRHAGWIYYQGGDQLWYYTLGWLLGHGQLTQTQVGYGWPVILAPLARIAGPNLVSALPAIILFNVLILLPLAMLALYGIAARIGGRLFGYWTLALWIAVPFIGIAYTNVGYHQRYTELLLPQALGLTALADFPTMVAALVSLYFCARVVFSDRPILLDAVAAGVAAGAAVAIKPSTALFLVGPVLAFASRRYFSALGAFVAGIAPAALTLAIWKERGLGHLPILNGAAPLPTGGGLASGAPILHLNFHRYLNLNWSHFGNNVDLLREHFWSGRVLQWLVIAGIVGLARRSRTALLLIGAPLCAFVIVKGSYISASVEDGSVFRILMPAFPLFIILLACLPLLFPHAPRFLRAWRPGLAEPSPRLRRSAVIAAVLLSAVIPIAAFAAANTQTGAADSGVLAADGMPIPANVDLGVSTQVSGRHVILHWKAARSIGGPAFYRIWRAPASTRDEGFTCNPSVGARWCVVGLPEIAVTHRGTYVDNPGKGQWVYRVAVAANWLNDPTYGDVYLVGKPVLVTVR
jgi:hypothetical protein